MMRAADLVASIALLRAEELEDWVRDELVAPRREEDEPVFSEMECARIRLICTLRYELEIEAETLPTVLSLLDQLYDTRERLLALSAAVAEQEEDVRRAILERLTAE